MSIHLYITALRTTTIFAKTTDGMLTLYWHSNPFDVAGARSAGLQAIWVDRPGTGWVDRASAHKPSKIVRSLGEIVDFIQQM